MFGAIAIIGLAAASGLVRPRGWTAPALVGASIVWSLTWVGSLLGQIGLLDGLKVGFWLLLLSVLVVMTGAALLLLSGGERERATETSPPEPWGALRP
jgi:hypothetical protein